MQFTPLLREMEKGSRVRSGEEGREDTLLQTQRVPLGAGGGTPWDRVNVRLGPCAGLFGTRWKQWNPHIPMTSVVLTFNADTTTKEIIS